MDSGLGEPLVLCLDSLGSEDFDSSVDLLFGSSDFSASEVGTEFGAELTDGWGACGDCTPGLGGTCGKVLGLFPCGGLVGGSVPGGGGMCKGGPVYLEVTGRMLPPPTERGIWEGPTSVEVLVRLASLPDEDTDCSKLSPLGGGTCALLEGIPAWETLPWGKSPSGGTPSLGIPVWGSPARGGIPVWETPAWGIPAA